MFVSDCLGVNTQGHLTIGKMDTVDLAKQYGTPLYVMDEATIRGNCRQYVDSVRKSYGGNGLVLYASKAFSCKELYRIVEQEHMGVDVVSGGELYTALQAGFPASKIYFHGNNKTEPEINMALDSDIGCFVVDNSEELALLDSLAQKKGKTADILLRITPGVDAHTHEFIKTGRIDSKFGFAIETGAAEEAVKETVGLRSVRLRGLHCHIGSQIFDIGPFEHTAEIMIQFMTKIKQKFGVEVERLNLGGGFGIKYIPSQDPVEYERYMEKISSTVKQACKAAALKMPFILLEPGRSIVASAGITLYTVGSVKTIPSVRTYVSVDGGMTDNPRYILYQAPYDAVIADRAAQARTSTVTIAGRCCESGDLIQENIALQAAKCGDILAVFATGAYNYSMASNYNRVPRPAVVMVRDEAARVIVKRESYDDLIQNDI